jgi:hypothetical protein
MDTFCCSESSTFLKNLVKEQAELNSNMSTLAWHHITVDNCDFQVAVLSFL